jgi:pyruvate formate lyase activating enzyme
LAPADSGPKVIESIKLLLTGRVPYEFRTTCVAPFISPTIMTRIGYWLKGARHYFLQPFRPDRVLKPDFFSHKTDGACDPEALRNIVAALVPNCRVRC